MGTARSLERFLTFLWDIGLEVGHSVRTIDDCQRESLADISVATTLLEARRLAGPEALFAAMKHALAPERALARSRTSSKAKVNEQLARHHRFPRHRLQPRAQRQDPARAACATSRPSAGSPSGTSVPNAR